MSRGVARTPSMSRGVARMPSGTPGVSAPGEVRIPERKRLPSIPPSSSLPSKLSAHQFQTPCLPAEKPGDF